MHPQDRISESAAGHSLADLRAEAIDAWSRRQPAMLSSFAAVAAAIAVAERVNPATCVLLAASAATGTYFCAGKNARALDLLQPAITGALAGLTAASWRRVPFNPRATRTADGSIYHALGDGTILRQSAGTLHELRLAGGGAREIECACAPTFMRTGFTGAEMRLGGATLKVSGNGSGSYFNPALDETFSWKRHAGALITEQHFTIDVLNKPLRFSEREVILPGGLRFTQFNGTMVRISHPERGPIFEHTLTSGRAPRIKRLRGAHSIDFGEVQFIAPIDGSLPLTRASSSWRQIGLDGH